MKKLIAILSCLVFTFTSNASITEQGQGMIFGKDHAFTVTAGKNWVLDNESAVRQGLHMVFYPKQYTWNNSPVIAYGRTISSKNGQTIKSQVEYTINDFRKNGSPNYTGAHQKDIKLSNGELASVYFYSGDKWGNYEAVAYIQEDETINFLVYNSRNIESFNSNLDVFYEMVSSYENRYTTSNLTPEDIETLSQKSDSFLASTEGKMYETNATKATAQQMSNALGQCTSYYNQSSEISFTYFVEIKPSGAIRKADITPSNSLTTCFKGLMSQAVYPKSNFDDFLLKVSVTITE